MILITDRAAELIEWIDSNCAATTYTLEDERRLFLNVGDEDRLIFDLRWHGCFIDGGQNISYDDTELNRLMLRLKGLISKPKFAP